MIETLEIYTDGGCSKDKLGGWAFTIAKNGVSLTSEYGSVENTTHNRMELMAFIKALEKLDSFSSEYNKFQKLAYTDSSYLADAISNDYFSKWNNNGWINSENKSVFNRDLWERIIYLLQKNEVCITRTKRSNPHIVFVDGLIRKKVLK